MQVTDNVQEKSLNVVLFTHFFILCRWNKRLFLSSYIFVVMKLNFFSENLIFIENSEDEKIVWLFSILNTAECVLYWKWLQRWGNIIFYMHHNAFVWLQIFTRMLSARKKWEYFYPQSTVSSFKKHFNWKCWNPFDIVQERRSGHTILS